MGLNLGAVLKSTLVTDVFDVERREQSVNAQGRGTETKTTFAGQRGSVCAASGNDLQRLDESDRMGRNISVVTSFALRGPAKVGGKTYKPDIVVWRGGRYVVKALDPYPQHGAGFVQAVCGSVEVVDKVPS